MYNFNLLILKLEQLSENYFFFLLDFKIIIIIEDNTIPTKNDKNMY